MRKQFVIVGLGKFGQCMLEELGRVNCEILLIDKDREKIDAFRRLATEAVVTDALSEEAINRIVPRTADAAIVDLSDNIEVSILVTHYLSKMGIREIMAQARGEQHGELLSVVGATRVVYPFREAAKRAAPLLYSPGLLGYMPIGREFVIAEVRAPAEIVGKSFVESMVRQVYGLTAVAVRRGDEAEYSHFSRDYRVRKDDLVLVAGLESDVAKFTQSIPEKAPGGLFARVLTRLRLRGTPDEAEAPG